MRPVIGSQFSRFGSNEVPYFSMTSGVSVMSAGRSISAETRSMFACVAIKFEIVRASCCTGSAITSA